MQARSPNESTCLSNCLLLPTVTLGGVGVVDKRLGLPPLQCIDVCCAGSTTLLDCMLYHNLYDPEAVVSDIRFSKENSQRD